MHKSEIHGPKYSHIFDALTAMSAEERINTPYFPDQESPRDTAARVTDWATTSLIQNHPGQTILCVTHSVVLESLLAVLRGHFYEGISMRRLAWFRVNITPQGVFAFEHIEGMEFKSELDLK